MTNNKFKQTEIGEIPDDWKVDALKNHVNIKGRIGWKGLKKSEYLKNGYAIINGLQIKDGAVDWKTVGRISKDRFEESPEIMLNKNDILMTKDGTIGKLAYLRTLPEASTVASGVFVIRNNSELLNQTFLFQYFHTPNFKSLVRSRIEGAVIPHLYQRDINELLIPLPPLNEQEQIASILSSLDDKIELNRRMNKTLEEIGKALFYQLFKLKNSSTCELNDIVDFNPKESLSKSANARFIEMKDLPEEGMWVSSEVIKPYKGGSKFRNGDSLMARITPCLENGKSGFVNSLNEDELAFGSTEFIVFRPKKAIYEEFVYFIVRDEEFRNHAIRSMVGSSGRQRVQIEAIKTYELSIPPKEAIEAFHLSTRPLFQQIKQNSLENKKLVELRDSLLPRLITGKIRLKV